MPSSKVSFYVPLNFAKDVLLNWPSYKFLIEAFNLLDAKIVKKEENSIYFSAHTKEFLVFPLFIAGKTTIKKYSVDFEFSIQRKKYSDYFSVIDKANKGFFYFSFIFEKNTLLLMEPNSSFSNSSTITKALEIASLGIEILYYTTLAEKIGKETNNCTNQNTFESNINNPNTTNQTPKGLKKYKFKQETINFFDGSDYIYSAFTLLELKPTKDIKIIKTNYRRLAREKHPDRIKDPKLKGYAGRDFIELSTAYDSILKWLEL